MRRFLFALAVLALPAHAQTTTSTSTTGSSAQASNRAASVSGAAIVQNFAPGNSRTEVVNSGRTGVDYSGSTTSNVNTNGTQTLRNVPSIYAPSFGGTNPCTVSASGGGAVAGFGITLGGSWASAECERRNLAVIAVQALNDPALAHELLCGTADFRAARLRMGRPCAEDMPVGTPSVQVVNVPAEPIAYTPREPGRLIRQSVPAWCDTVGPRDPPAARAACGR